MITKKTIEFALRLMNLLSSSNNNLHFIREIVASPESSQLKKNGSSYRKFKYFLGGILDVWEYKACSEKD